MSPPRLCGLRAILIAAALAALSACVAEPPRQASDAEVAMARYAGSAPHTISLVTNIRNLTGKGAHSALIVNASEIVVFNPAGTWWHPQAPEQGDVHHNFSPGMRQWFIDYHARATYRVQIQTVEVSPEVAEAALRAVEQIGTAGEAFCTLEITRVLHGLPGFEGYGVSFFPSSAAREFAKLPGVTTEVYRDDSPGDRSDLGSYAPS